MRQTQWMSSLFSVTETLCISLPLNTNASNNLFFPILTWHILTKNLSYQQDDMSTWTDKFKNNVFVPVKVSIWPTGFYGFGICITFQTKNYKFWCFLAIKSSFKYTTSAIPNEVDWWWMMLLQEHLKAWCFYFACMTTALLHQLWFTSLFVFADETKSPSS